MSMYRKKPVEIEARQVTHENAPAVAAWCNGVSGWAKFAGPGEKIDTSDAFGGITFPTLEGTMNAKLGDWIIKGVKGEFYPCKPDVVDATYEPATETGHVLVVSQEDGVLRYRIECPRTGGGECGAHGLGHDIEPEDVVGEFEIGRVPVEPWTEGGNYIGWEPTDKGEAVTGRARRKAVRRG